LLKAARIGAKPLAIRPGGFAFERSLEWLLNDALMVSYFFALGLQLRREIQHGELSEWPRAALPAFAAVGGRVVPACMYLGLANSASAHSGWGIPMATEANAGVSFAGGRLEQGAPSAASLPARIGWRELTVLGVVAGVGLTLSLFVAQRAFGDAGHLGAAKIGVLSSSALVDLGGLALGLVLLSPVTNANAATTADEAECSTQK